MLASVVATPIAADFLRLFSFPPVSRLLSTWPPPILTSNAYGLFLTPPNRHRCKLLGVQEVHGLILQVYHHYFLSVHHHVNRGESRILGYLQILGRSIHT